MTPVFLVSATTVMCDVAMLGFWTWAMAQWVEGVRTSDRRRLTLAVALAAACVLTKYNGITLLPLLWVYAVAYRGRLDRRDALLVVPLLVLAAWLVVMASLYGLREVLR
jgi:4-amino-4-deoxy-L-arabinose transferase-like glycosyltransferase